MESAFTPSWDAACREPVPDPDGAAGRLMELFSQRLGIEQVQVEKLPNAAIFLFDLSKLGHPGLDFNVMMITHPPLDEQEELDFAAQLSVYRNTIKSAGYCFHIVLHEETTGVAGPGPQSMLSDVVRMGGRDLRRLFSEPMPAPALYAIIGRQIPIRKFCPYNTQHQARGAMFVNRDKELQSLNYDLVTSFGIMGSRRIGKSSLLLKSYDSLRHRRGFENRVFHYDCRSWGYWADCVPRILGAIDPRESRRSDYTPDVLVSRLEALSHLRGGPLILIFDEADRIVDFDRSIGWELSSRLSVAAEYNHIRVIFAGYRSVHRLWEDGQSPFHARITPLRLRPFNRKDTEELIRIPMQSVGIQFKDSKEVLDRIWRATEGYPFMVQFLGKRLFEKVADETPGVIHPEDVDEFVEDDDTIRFIYSHFRQNTLVSDLPQVTERLCSVLFAEHVVAHGPSPLGWSDDEFLKACRNAGRSLSIDTLDQTLQNLCKAAILTETHGRYRFAFPLIPKVLKLKFPDTSEFLRSLEVA